MRCIQMFRMDLLCSPYNAKIVEFQNSETATLKLSESPSLSLYTI